MYIDRFEIMKHTFIQTFTINYYPNNPSLPLYLLALLLTSTTSNIKKFTVLFLNYKPLKLQLRVSLAGHTVAMVTYHVI